MTHKQQESATSDTANRLSSNVPGAASIQGLHDPRLYINRELSWLAFSERVLDQARLETHPLLERVKFLAIAANNLDEFFMIRVATSYEPVHEDGAGAVDAQQALIFQKAPG